MEVPVGLRRLRGIAMRATAVGALDPRIWLAGAATLPWVIGRGPSLASICQVHAWSSPSATAILDRRGPLSWGELAGRVNRLARGYRDLGVLGGDQVMVLLRNGREFCEAVLAAQTTGAVAAPLNTWSRATELTAILDRERPAVLIYDIRHADQLAAIPRGTRLVHVGADEEAVPESIGYDQVLADRSGLPPLPVRTSRGTNRILIHTSGTTGVPKAASRSTGLSMGSALLAVLEVIPFRRDDVLYVPNPLFHSLGLLALAIGFGVGATVVLPDRFDPRLALEDLDAHSITAASFVPLMLRRMLDLGDPPDADLSTMRVLLVSGSAMSVDLRQRVRERFGDVVYDLYGSTEAGWVSIATPETMRAAPGAVGRPVPGVEVALLDGDGRPSSTGDGVIAVRGGATFEGYTSGEDSDQPGGYLSTGDLGRFDDHGYLHVVGRADDMVVVGGENVYPSEVEAVIEAIDGVSEAAVRGVADEEFGSVLAAFVIGRVRPDEVRDACEQRLPSYKVPRRVEIVSALPRTASGKIRRSDLPPAAPL